MRLLLAAIALALTSSCGRSNDTESIESAPIENISDHRSTEDPLANTTLAQRLAILEENRFVEVTHIKAARYQSLLDQLDNQYIESDQQIANMTLIAQEQLREKGLEVQVMAIMEGINRLYYNMSHTNESYAGIASLYVLGRDSGLEHSEAIEGIQQLISGLGLAP